MKNKLQKLITLYVYEKYCYYLSNTLMLALADCASVDCYAWNKLLRKLN